MLGLNIKGFKSVDMMEILQVLELLFEEKSQAVTFDFQIQN